MGLVKTRRLAAMHKQTTYAIHLRRGYGGQEAMVVKHRAKAGMKPPVKKGGDMLSAK